MTTKLKWIVQNNLYEERGYAKFIGALERFGCDFIIVKPVPFTNVILSEDFDATQVNDITTAPDPLNGIDEEQPIIAMGATSLTRIAKSRNWAPGTYHNENHHYDLWNKNFGEDNMLNPKSESKVGLVKDFFGYEPTGDVFIRPTEDTKSISGTVMSKYDFYDWVQMISMITPDELLTPLHQDTEIVISPVKEIYSECRLFVVGGEVVTQSMYKRGNVVRSDVNVDQRFIDFTQKMVNEWEVSIGFVMDVADTPKGLKVIEINCLNSSGFYDCDPLAIVAAIEQLHNRD